MDLYLFTSTVCVCTYLYMELAYGFSEDWITHEPMDCRLELLLLVIVKT